MSEHSEYGGLVLRFEEATRGEATRLAADLRNTILDRAAPGSDLEIEIRREDSTAMDFGSSLVLMFGTGAIVAIAEGIKTWLAKRGTSIKVTTESGEVVLTGDAAKGVDVAAVAAALSRHARRSR